MSSWDSPIEKAESTAKSAANKFADTAERTVDSARAMANDTLDKAESKVRSLREDMQPTIDAISSRVQDMAERSKTMAADTTAKTRETLNQYADKTSTYVSEKPLQSMAMAAAAGAVLAMLLGRRR